MTVAPELPPAPVVRRRGSRLRVVVDRTPAGVVALVEPPRPRRSPAPARAAVVVPPPPAEPAPGRPRHPAGRGSASPSADLRPSGRPTPGLRPSDLPPSGQRTSGLWPADAVPSAVRLGRAEPVGVRPGVRPSEVRPLTDRPGSPAWPTDVAAGARTARAMGPRPVGARVVRPAPGHLRLTRRGRLVTAAATLLIAALTLVGVVSRAGSLHETAPVPASAPAQVVVAPGETLWSIAERVAPDRDPRTVVAGLQRLNGLPTADVRAGRTLLLRAP